MPTAEHITEPGIRLPNGDRKALGELIASRLKEVRGPRSLEFIAGRTGVHPQTVWRYEKGDIPAAWLFLSKLRDNEGIDLNEFLAMEGVAQPQ